MAKISSGINFTSDYYLGTFYTNNRDASKKSTRGNFSNVELAFEDSRALTRAAKRLKRNDYTTAAEDGDITESVKASIEAFASTYNNMIESGKGSDDSETKRYLKQLKTLTKKHAEELEDIGITIENDGRLSVNSELLSMADNETVSKLFSPEEEYVKKSLTIASRLNDASFNDILAQINSKNLHINITI